jgi:hypothetical protein
VLRYGSSPSSKVTTYRGDHGTILGPWATSRWIDTTDGTHAGAVVADASVLSKARQEPSNAAGQDFGVWLRHSNRMNNAQDWPVLAGTLGGACSVRHWRQVPPCHVLVAVRDRFSYQQAGPSACQIPV